MYPDETTKEESKFLSRCNQILESLHVIEQRLNIVLLPEGPSKGGSENGLLPMQSESTILLDKVLNKVRSIETRISL